MSDKLIDEKNIEYQEGVFCMRIENLYGVTQVYNKKNTIKSNKAVNADSSDQLEISQAGRDFQLAKKAVSSSSDVREDLVKDIKSRMEAGTYEVSADDFASKVIEKYNQFMM